MSWHSYYTMPFQFIRDIYWRGIPERCRDCGYVYVCRSSWKQGRKCHNGCIMLNNVRDWKREEDRRDYTDNLVEYVESMSGNSN